MTSSPLGEDEMSHAERLPIPDGGLSVAASDDGNLGIQLPDGRPMWVCGPNVARAIAEALTAAAEVADTVRAELTARHRAGLN